MSETWDQTKARLALFGVKIKQTVAAATSMDIGSPNVRPISRRFNIHKRSLPPGIDKPVVFNVAKKEAEWWIDRILRTRCYINDPDDSKTLVYYDAVPIGATPRERSIYYNTKEITTEDVPGYDNPRRVY